MDYFEKITRKITNASQNVTSSAKKMTDVVRFNNIISDYEKEIMSLYVSVGKAYYEKHKDDEFAEEVETIKKITELDKQISSLQEQVKALKGLSKCPQCGADVKKDVLFCSNCGNKMPEPKAENCCPQCGASVHEDSAFCSNCGTKIVKEENAFNGETVVVTDNDEQQKCCASCNFVLSDDDVFCPECGNKIE